MGEEVNNNGFRSTLKWSAILGMFGVVANFFGYIYLKGLINGLGLGDYNITLSVHDGLYWSTRAIAKISENLFTLNLVNVVWSEVVALDSIIVLSFSALFLVFVLNYRLKKSVDSVSDQRTEKVSDRLLWFKKRVHDWKFQAFFAVLLAPPFMFIGQLVFLLFLTVALGAVFLFLSFGYLVGDKAGKDIIVNAVCSELKWEESSPDVVPSCSRLISSGNKEHVGFLVFASRNESIFVTNERTMIFDSDHRLVHYSIIQRKRNLTD